jgi:hypothetical protein
MRLIAEMLSTENIEMSQIDETTGSMSPFANRIAHDFLAADGISAIWKLHLSAVVVREAGYGSAAQILLDAADIAEELWRHLAKDFAERWAARSDP